MDEMDDCEDDGDNEPAIEGIYCGCGSSDYYTVDMNEHHGQIDFKCVCHGCDCAFFVSVSSSHEWRWRGE